MNENEISLGTLYEVNKNLVQNAEKELTEGVLNSKKEIVKNFVNKTNNYYYMLLCNERKDYTIFTIGNIENKEQKIEKLPFVLIDECLKNRGEIRVIELTEDKDAIDAVDAILPAGTLSGAPKFRACQIIEELEHSKRGIYGGAIGYLDFTGNLDTCIAIRLVYKKKGEICIRSGAGIVADSSPESELQETENKARAVIRAAEQVQDGEDYSLQ